MSSLNNMPTSVRLAADGAFLVPGAAVAVCVLGKVPAFLSVVVLEAALRYEPVMPVGMWIPQITGWPGGA